MQQISLEEFTEIIKDVKFTPAQKKVVDRLIKGDKIWIINPHRMNGGEWHWKTEHSVNPEYAGRVYKAFWNVQWEIKRQKRLDIDFSLFFHN
jgi:hypothetical protein